MHYSDSKKCFVIINASYVCTVPMVISVVSDSVQGISFKTPQTQIIFQRKERNIQETTYILSSFRLDLVCIRLLIISIGLRFCYLFNSEVSSEIFVIFESLDYGEKYLQRSVSVLIPQLKNEKNNTFGDRHASVGLVKGYLNQGILVRLEFLRRPDYFISWDPT